METLTHEETTLSVRSLVTAGVAALCSAALVAPGLVVPGYVRAVAVAVLVVLVGGAVRVVVATAVAAPRREPPALPDSASLPTVSLVVTAYDEADVLRATIDACTAVAYPDERLQVVVGYEAASSDGTAAVARAAAADDPRVTALERPGPPGGKASATNHALTAATGTVVGVLDADQRLEPDAVERAVRWLADESVACVKGRCFGTNPTASIVALCATAERGLVERTEFVARDRLGGFSIFTGGQAFFRTDDLDARDGFDESVLLEDLDMAYRLQRAGRGVRVDPGIVSRERNPTTASAWWNQRKRWARGGMQVARRYLGATLRSGSLPLRARLDFAATVGTLLLLPVLVLAIPVLALSPAAGAPVGGPGVWLVGLALSAPFVAWYGTVALDARDGYRHHPLEFAAPLLLWPYAAVQACAIVAAFVDEFVLRRATRYVTS